MNRWRLWRWWVRWVARMEKRNHPYAMRYHDYDDSHWGPVSERVCWLADHLTRYGAHD